MDNTLEHLHQHHEGAHHLHHQMDHQLAAATTTTTGGQSPSMISYDQPAMHHQDHQYQHMSMMKMYFHFGLGDMVLFPNLVMDSHSKLWLTCAVLFLAALLLEMIDYSRGYLSCRCQSSQTATSSRRGKSTSTTSSETGLVDDGGSPQSQQDNMAAQHRRRQWNCCAGLAAAAHPSAGQDDQPTANYGGTTTWHGKAEYFEPKFFPVRSHEPQLYRMLQASLQFVRTGLSLCLMLVAMTYNVCLIFAILLGSAVGYYIFYRPALDSKSVVCH